MKLEAARALAESLMAKHLTPEWSFHFFSARRKGFGYCQWKAGVRGGFIGLNKYMLNGDWKLRTEDGRRPLTQRYLLLDTILHEIAHAKAGRRAAAHGPRWMRECIRIGACPAGPQDPMTASELAKLAAKLQKPRRAS